MTQFAGVMIPRESNIIRISFQRIFPPILTLQKYDNVQQINSIIRKEGFVLIQTQENKNVILL